MHAYVFAGMLQSMMPLNLSPQFTGLVPVFDNLNVILSLMLCSVIYSERA